MVLLWIQRMGREDWSFFSLYCLNFLHMVIDKSFDYSMVCCFASGIYSIKTPFHSIARKAQITFTLLAWYIGPSWYGFSCAQLFFFLFFFVEMIRTHQFLDWRKSTLLRFGMWFICHYASVSHFVVEITYWPVLSVSCLVISRTNV